jgi:hypothetical protein
MTEWARRESGKVVEVVTSYLPDPEFLTTRPGQDLVHLDEIPYAQQSIYFQEEAERLGQPPRPIGRVQPPIEGAVTS